jgi:L-ascorbate metabolism protein UlaG (beta-lactamase superfamily)
MRLGDLEFHYVSHVCFVFRSPGGAILVPDPFFAPSFWWNGHVERYLSPPEFPVERMTTCDLVFISHIHGDHFDADAVCAIRKQTGARIIAPYDVIDVLLGRGEPKKALIAAEEGKEVREKDLSIIALDGYDRSVDSRGFPNKFSALIRSGNTQLFYSGDCHELPPAMQGKEVDGIFWWPHPDENKVRVFCGGLKFKNWVIMHGDRFEPGEFLCNLNMEEQRRRMLKSAPHANIIVPERAQGFPY